MGIWMGRTYKVEVKREFLLVPTILTNLGVRNVSSIRITHLKKFSYYTSRRNLHRENLHRRRECVKTGCPNHCPCDQTFSYVPQWGTGDTPKERCVSSPFWFYKSNSDLLPPLMIRHKINVLILYTSLCPSSRILFTLSLILFH